MASNVFSSAHEEGFPTANFAMLAPVVMGLSLGFTIHSGSSGVILSDIGSKGISAKHLTTKPDTDPDAIKAQFELLAAQWVAETTSSSSDYWHYVSHWTYQMIIGMGWDVVPLILESLRRTPDHWGWALEVVTGENPVPAEAAGDIEAIAEAWINWGRARNLVS
jgi:hypothetical protein